MVYDRTTKPVQLPVVLVGEWHNGERNYGNATAILRTLEPLFVTIERMPGTDYSEYHKRVYQKSADDVATVREWLKRTDGTLLACIDYVMNSHNPRVGLSCIDAMVGRLNDVDAALVTPWEKKVLALEMDGNGSLPDKDVNAVCDDYRNGTAKHSKEFYRAMLLGERNKSMATIIRDLSEEGTVVHFSGSAHIFGLKPTIGSLLNGGPVRNVLLDTEMLCELYDVYAWQRDECKKARNK